MSRDGAIMFGDLIGELDVPPVKRGKCGRSDATTSGRSQTRDEMRQTIHDFLYSDDTGLPESYGEGEISAKTEAIFAHAYRAYS